MAITIVVATFCLSLVGLAVGQVRQLQPNRAISVTVATSSDRLWCGFPPKVDSAIVASQTCRNVTYNPVGCWIQYKCSPAYAKVISGSLTVTCLQNGTWSDTPVCAAYSYQCRSTEAAREYKGRMSVSRCGYPCQNWNMSQPSQGIAYGMKNMTLFPEAKNPSEAVNFCRNPDPTETSGPWCFIGGTTAKWDFCDVHYCDERDTFDTYDRFLGTCGCNSHWYNAMHHYGNLATLSKVEISTCKAECDSQTDCLGFVYDEELNKCWLKKCACNGITDVICTAGKYETYYRKKQQTCPGIEFVDANGGRHCYYTIYTFNFSSSLTWNWTTSRQLCKDLLGGDLISFETMAEEDFIIGNMGRLNLPNGTNFTWIGLMRESNVPTQEWKWISKAGMTYTNWIGGHRGPDNGFEAQCVEMVVEPSALVGVVPRRVSVGQWIDTRCTKKIPAICEVEMSSVASEIVQNSARIQRPAN